MYWQPGQKLKTRPYQIEAMIGQGGFGVTYKARHLSLKHQVVLKTPNAMLRNDPAYPRFEERFRKEGQMLAQLSQQSHPSIVRVSDQFTEDDIPCLVMDLVPGDSLFNLVQERGPIPETQAVSYIRQIAEALVVSHDMIPGFWEFGWCGEVVAGVGGSPELAEGLAGVGLGGGSVGALAQPALKRIA